MPIKRITRLVCLTVALAALLPATASAQSGITGQTMFGTAFPYMQDPVEYGPASLRIVWDTTYNPAAHPSNQTLLDANIHFDNDFAFDTTGLAQCDPATLTNTMTAAAIAACPGALLGMGGELILTGSGGFTLPAVLTTFNATPSGGGSPRVILHVRIGPPTNVTVLILGTIGPSARGGDFGSQIFFATVPDTAATGTVITHVDARFDQEPQPGRFFFTARCFDADHYWNYAGDFAFRNGGGFFPAMQVQQCTNPPPMTALAPIVIGKPKKKCKKKPRKRCGKKPKP